MRDSPRSTTFRALLAFLLATSLAAPSFAQRVDLDATSSDAVRSQLRVSRFTAQRILPPPMTKNGRLTVIVDFDDSEVALDLEPRPVRADDFALYLMKNGRREEVVPPPERTFRGDAFFATGGLSRWRAAATIEGGKVTAFLHSEDGELRCIQPLSDVLPGAEASLHVAYRGEDVAPHAGRCAVDVLNETIGVAKSGGAPGWLPESAASNLKLAEIAFEGDTFYYAAKGSSGATALADLDTLMNAIISIYEAQVGITYLVTAFLLQTDGSEQYASSNANTLLTQFKNFWNANEGGIHRDTVHLLTGRNIQGGTIGIAFVGVVCNLNFAYGLAQTTWSPNLLDRVSLSAHEIGHNWNANHCDGIPDCGIMCSFINACSGDYQVFGHSEQNEIEAFRDTLNCLTIVHPPTEAPFLDLFEQGSLDGELWQSDAGAAVSTAAQGETSGKHSVALSLSGSGADKLISKAIDPSALASAELAFFVEHRGVESGETLAVQFKNAAGTWVDLVTITSHGAKQSTFTPEVVALPPAAMFNGVKFRFKPAIDDSGDDWYLDDVAMRATSPPSAAGFCPDLPSPLIFIHRVGAGDPSGTLAVGNCGTSGGVLQFSAAEVVDVPWLALTAASGTLGSLVTSNVNANVTAAAASAGMQTARVRFTQTNGAPSDTYDVPVTLLELDAAAFEPGDHLTGAISIASEIDKAYFVGVAGEKLTVKLTTATSGLKTTVRVFDPSDTQLIEMKLNGTGQSQSVTLPATGLHHLTVEGRNATVGSYALSTTRSLPATASASAGKFSPAIAGGTVSANVLALPGATLDLSAVPKATGFGPLSITVSGPLGESLNAQVFSLALPDGGVLVKNLPLLTGDHTITVSGFAGTEAITLTLDPQQPQSTGASVSID